MPARKATIERKTKETQLKISLNLDGSGKFSGSSGMPFLDHMLELFAKHGLFDLRVQGRGDLEVDGHHTTEDLGIVLGECLAQALGDKKGIARYGAALIPMDETLAQAVVDLSDRPFFVWNVNLGFKEQVGNYDVELTEEFWRAFTMSARMNLHLAVLYGTNVHHKQEGLFKAAARALAQAVARDPRVKGVPSTKGKL